MRYFLREHGVERRPQSQLTYRPVLALDASSVCSPGGNGGSGGGVGIPTAHHRTD